MLSFAAIFKLKVQNIAFFAVAPTLMSQYCYQSSINERVDYLWKIHQNRVKKGLGGTATKTGLYEQDAHVGDRAFRANTGLHISMDSIVSGVVDKPMFDNPFKRFHQSLADYGHDHGNLDDVNMYETHNYERIKATQPKDGSTVGTTTLAPTQDNDEKLVFYDVQGESLYSNPPDPNVPLVDHGLDELTPWAWRKTNFNQKVISNPFIKDPWKAMQLHNAPWWGKKLQAPVFFTEEKYQKFFEQWEDRKGLAEI